MIATGAAHALSLFSVIVGSDEDMRARAHGGCGVGWTMEQLHERLVEYEGQLVAAGYTEGTIGSRPGVHGLPTAWLAF